MVIGSIVNWVVFRTLDLSASAIWWLTKSSVYGVYSIGHYMIVPKDIMPEKIEMVHLTEKELLLFREHNELLKIQNKLLEETCNPNEKYDQNDIIIINDDAPPCYQSENL